MWGKPVWLSVESYGLVLVLISAIFYAYAGALVKLAHVQGDLPSTELVLARGIFQGSLVVLGLYLSKDLKGQRLIRWPFGKSKAAQQLVWMRGFIGGAGFLLDYHCMAVVPLGDAITLMSLYPFITIILARIFLKEEIRALHIGVTLASLIGAVLIAQPTFVFGSPEGETPPTLGYITGLLGSCCLASILILIRKAGKIGVHTFQLLLSWALFGVLFSIIIGPWEGTWKWPATPAVAGYVAGVCLVGAGAHFILNYAGRLAPAGLVSVVRASDIVWAYGFELTIFPQRPTLYTWFGVLLILGSLVAVGLDKMKASKEEMSKAQTTKLGQASEGDALSDEENPTIPTNNSNKIS